MSQTRMFSDFKVGDTAVFEQSFSAQDFAAFAALSGDHNPLHHDAAYASESEFEKTIVPMHMTMAPMSRIAGMIFPGDPSLYLGHDIRSALPVFYGDKLVYSAQIVSINPTLRTLTIRLLVCRDAEVVLDAQMRVMSRLESWEPQAAASGYNSPAPDQVLITGATGEIGTAIAMTLARRGCNLLLVDRGAGAKRDALASALQGVTGADQTIEHLTADLARPSDVAALCADLSARADVAKVIHTASPPLSASLEDLVQVNYAALRDISQAVAAGMLHRQSGHVVSLGSVATERVIPDWEDYSAVKAMAAQFTTRLDKTYAAYGVRGLTVLSGLVATAYSADVQGDAPAMLPQELAEKIATLVYDDAASRSALVEWSGSRSGDYGFHEPSTGPVARAAAPTQAAATAPVAAVGTGGGLADQIDDILRTRLRLPADTQLAGGGVGVTQGWDSLRHIELVLELEQAFGIRYTAQDMEKVMMYDALVTITQDRVASGGGQS